MRAMPKIQDFKEIFCLIRCLPERVQALGMQDASFHREGSVDLRGILSKNTFCLEANSPDLLWTIKLGILMPEGDLQYKNI